MKSILLIFLTLITLNTVAQPDSVFVNEIQNLRAKENYSEIVSLLNEASISNPDNLWLNYQLACYYSISTDTINSIIYLNKAIKAGANGMDIMTDTDFENIHTCTEWKITIKRLEEIYLNQNPEITHKELAIELWHMYIDDQRYRTLGKNYKKPFPKFGTLEYLEFNKVQMSFVEANKKRLKNIIKEYGWPTYSMVGIEAADAAFYIFQHAERKYLKKYLPYLKNAAMANEASKANYAKMFDRLLLYCGKKQYYGTQLVSFGNIDKDGNRKKSKMVFYPISDYKAVNERRLGMDIEPIEAYAKRMGVEYNPNANVKMHKY